ncbi:hypothetical protein P280DRAFT_197512 [Massarina eburnea CBS 473.64]|uniref:Uncharacterized protein n=1 Tax=Massarina eburnea CBS 473.64 TaxID=1395130 RepID=A0A6A6RIP7_9PLEO|nr:hypothetical protein P280DRAFT_197512 [Massarina eburnea CBS 473.64]
MSMSHDVTSQELGVEVTRPVRRIVNAQLRRRISTPSTWPILPSSAVGKRFEEPFAPSGHILGVGLQHIWAGSNGGMRAYNA